MKLSAINSLNIKASLASVTELNLTAIDTVIKKGDLQSITLVFDYQGQVVSSTIIDEEIESAKGTFSTVELALSALSKQGIALIPAADGKSIASVNGLPKVIPVKVYAGKVLDIKPMFPDKVAQAVVTTAPVARR